MNVIQKSFFLLGKDTKKLPWVLLLFLILSAVEVAGIGLIGPYMKLILDPDLQSDLANYISNISAQDVSVVQVMVMIGLALGIFFIIRCVCGVAINAKIISFSEAQKVRLKLHLLETYQSMSSKDSNERNTAEYINSIHVLTGYYSGNVLYYILKFISESLISLSLLCLLAYQNISIVLTLVAVLLVFIAGWDIYSRAKLKFLGVKVNKKSAEALSYLRESLDGYEELRVLGKNELFHKRFETNSMDLSAAQRLNAIYSSVPKYMLELAIFLFVVIVCTGSLFITSDFTTLIPTLAIFGMASVRLLPSASLLAQAIVVIRHNSNTVSLLYQDYMDGLSRSKNYFDTDCVNIHSFEDLELKNVEFSYNSNSKKVITDLNLKIRAGDSIGLVGTSGSGKSTLVNLIQGLITPTAGHILINKVPIAQCIEDWHSRLAVIPQNVFLLDGSIASNVCLEFDAESIDLVKLDKALKMASIDGYINSLPDGINTQIGEKGVFLSGGQKQRLVLARVFYHQRDFLIMDEATSALDAATESVIVNEIVALKSEITMIIIAHRLSTIEHCDHVFKIDNGTIKYVNKAK